MDGTVQCRRRFAVHNAQKNQDRFVLTYLYLSNLTLSNVSQAPA